MKKNNMKNEYISYTDVYNGNVIVKEGKDMKEIYRVIFWNDAGEIKVTAPTFYEDAYNTADKWGGVIYRMEKTQPTKGKR